jgi:hypothetical protein
MLTDITTLSAFCHNLAVHLILWEKYVRLEMALLVSVKGAALAAHSTLICRSMVAPCAVVWPTAGLNSK